MKDKGFDVKIPTDPYLSPYRIVNWGTLTLYILSLYYIMINIYTYMVTEKCSFLSIGVKLLIPYGIMGIFLMNLFFISLYYFQIPYFEQFKVNGLEWPWLSNPDHFYKILPGAIKTYIFNISCYNVYLMIFGLIFKPSINPKTLPSLSVFVIQILFAILCEDFVFYWSHRALHKPWLYSRVHKKHHEFYDIIHISSINTHWFEFFLGNILPLFASLMILRDNMHVVTLMSWIFFRNTETHECHSGYEFPWSVYTAIPFMNDSSYHNFHHLKNIGNYASFFKFWDSIFGTNKYYYEMKHEIETEKKHL